MVAAAVIGAGVLGAVSTSSAANKQAGAASNAANQQLQASREANQLQWQMYQQNLANQKPFMQGGQMAYSSLLGGMGINPYSGAHGPGQATPASNAMNLQGQPVDAQGNVIPGGQQNYGASNEQLAGANTQFAGQFNKNFGPNDLQLDPGYQFRLDQGLQALKASGAASGMLQTGQGLKNINDYAQGSASQEYSNAFNRYQTQQSNLFNRLGSLAGISQTAANQVGQAGQTAANTIGANTMAGASAAGNYNTQAAAASGAGMVGASNALTGAGNTWMNYQMGQQYMNKFGGQNPTGYAPNPASTPIPQSYDVNIG